MGSLRSRLAGKPGFVAAGIVAVAGIYLVAAGGAPETEAPTDSPAAQLAKDKTSSDKTADKGAEKVADKTSDKSGDKPADKAGEKSAATTAPTTSPTTSPTTQPSGATHAVKAGKLSFLVNGEGVFVADEPFEVRLKFE